LQQKGAGQRMAVAGRDLGAAAEACQTGLGQAAADLEDAFVVVHRA
jgi:hypothetical protein